MTVPHGETVTVTRPGAETRYGDPTPGTMHTVHGCVFAPRESAELHEQRNTVIVGVTMSAPAGSDIRATDEIVRAGGTRYQVEGEPGGGMSPFTGRAARVRVALRRVSG